MIPDIIRRYAEGLAERGTYGFSFPRNENLDALRQDVLLAIKRYKEAKLDIFERDKIS